MAWLVVNKKGIESIFEEKPERDYTEWYAPTQWVDLPKGTIEKLIGKELSWQDDPVEIK